MKRKASLDCALRACGLMLHTCEHATVARSIQATHFVSQVLFFMNVFSRCMAQVVWLRNKLLLRLMARAFACAASAVALVLD